MHHSQWIPLPCSAEAAFFRPLSTKTLVFEILWHFQSSQKGLWPPRAKKTQSHTITLIAKATFSRGEFLGNMWTVILTTKTSGTHVFYDTFAFPTIGTHVFYDTFASPTIGTHVFYDTFASPTIETHVFYDTFKLLNSKTSGNTETVAIFPKQRRHDWVGVLTCFL